MTAFDEGFLSPGTVGHDELVCDEAFLRAVVRAELALIGAYGDIGMLSTAELTTIELTGADRASSEFSVASLAEAAVGTGNPMIPVIADLRSHLPDGSRIWVHRGATSQDIWDTAIMTVSRDAVAQVRDSLVRTAAGLRRLAAAHGDDVVAARTLTQHAVPTTVGARIDGWLRGIERAVAHLSSVQFPAQLAGAGGTLASFVEIAGSPEHALALVEAFARRVDLAVPAGSWQVSRWPVTELGDALVQAVDALGKVATDVATLSRTEIGEMAEGTGGGSSAMPQKRNPVEATLIRSASIRAPQLGATLHLAAALAGDERPDGAWHAEWPTLRELLRLALGASAHAASLAENLRIDPAAGARNLALTRGLIVSERLAIVLTPLIGRARFDTLIEAAAAGADLGELLRGIPETADLDAVSLLDPVRYLGVARTPEKS